MSNNTLSYQHMGTTARGQTHAPEIFSGGQGAER